MKKHIVESFLNPLKVRFRKFAKRFDAISSWDSGTKQADKYGLELRLGIVTVVECHLDINRGIRIGAMNWALKVSFK